MELSHKLKALLLCLCYLLGPQAYARDQQGLFEGLETFFALSAVLGNTETNLVNRDFQRVNSRENFINLNVEIQLRWNGLFYENPGRSQESVDGLFSGDAIGYNFYNNEYWALDVYAVNAFADTEYTFDTLVEERGENDQVINRYVDRLRLNRKRDYRLGLRATGYYKDYLAQFIVTPMSFRSEIGGVNASASLRRTWLVKNWNVYATVGLNYQSSEIIDYYFGLPDAEAQLIAEQLNTNESPFQAYRADHGFFAVGEVGFEYPVTEYFVFGGFITSIARPDAVKDSTLSVSGRYVTTAALSLTWVF